MPRAPEPGLRLNVAHDVWQVGARFALGGAIGLCGAVASIVLLSMALGPNVGGSGADVTVTSALALSGQARLALMAAAAACTFFIGGFIAGASLSDTRKYRVAFGLAFLSAGMLLTPWLLGLWIGHASPWYWFALQGTGGAIIWTLAGALAAVILHDSRARLKDALAGFGLGGLAGGLSLTAGLLVLAAFSGRGTLAHAAYLAGVVLLCVLPAAIGGAMLARKRHGTPA